MIVVGLRVAMFIYDRDISAIARASSFVGRVELHLLIRLRSVVGSKELPCIGYVRTMLFEA